MILEVAVVVIAACLLAMTLGMIPVLLAARRAFVEAHKLVEQVRLQTAPLVHDATEIAVDVRNLVKSIEKEMPKVSQSIDSIRGTTQDIQEFERMLRERVERPLLDLTAIVAGLARGFVVFWRTLGRGR